MPIGPGTIIKHGPAEYIVGEMLGSGGFAVAYRATYGIGKFRVPKQAVVKVPTERVFSDLSGAHKFAREARILANISHPHVVKNIAFVEHEGEMAIIQELVHNASHLDDYIATNPSFAMSLFLQALYGLRAFHEGQPSIVHRDLSPSNMLVAPCGHLKIIDFGLAKEHPRLANDALTRSYESFGTHGCMSPEQLASAGKVDQRTDLFALGRCFAAALQGVTPAQADPHDLEEPWKTLCVKLARPDPAKRYSSADEVIQEALTLIAKHKILVENLDLHIQEINGRPSSEAGEFMSFQLLSVDPDVTSVELLSSLREDIFSFGMDAQLTFECVENSTAISDYESASLSFDAADYLGELYRMLYPYLDPQGKEDCFRRVCSVALKYHRYSTMGDVRSIYQRETDPTLCRRLVEILKEEDPGEVIHGRGVIPL